MGKSTPLFDALFNSGTREEQQDRLRQVAREHPYFAPAHFYLLQQMTPQDHGYELQVTKTTLLFNNPYWLSFQLQENGIEIAKDDQTSAADKKQVVIDEPLQLSPVTDHDGDQKNEFIENESIENSQPEHVDTTPGEGEIKSADAVEQVSETKDNTIDEPADALMPQHVAETGSMDNIKVEEITVKSVNDEAEDNADAAKATATAVEDAPPEILRSDEFPIKSIEPDNAVQQDNVGDQEMQKTAPQIEGEEEPGISQAESIEIEPLTVRLKLDTPVIAEDAIAFEPLHTTDYFASQGIKLSADIPSNDKLGKQLRSFTEWLKTMKKVHTNQLADTGNQTDATIQKLAEKSNTEDEVLTEAMAEVLVQQGKAGKATELYKKLSLLNPSKYAYFAAKIEQLKEQ